MKYSYKCEACGEVVEKEFPMQDEHPKVVLCPICNTETAYRMFTTSIQIPYSWNQTRIKTHKKQNKRFY